MIFGNLQLGSPDVFVELAKKVTSSPLPPNLLTSIRAVANLFKNSMYHDWLQKKRAEVSDEIFLRIMYFVSRDGVRDSLQWVQFHEDRKD